MNDFEKLYEEAVKECGPENAKAVAESMFQKGMDVSLTELLKKFTNNFQEAIPVLQWAGYTISEQSVGCNASTVSLNQEVLINDKKYHSWIQVLTFSDDEMDRINRIARDRARQILDSTPICDMEYVLTLAVIAGYNMGKAEPEPEDFECDEDYEEEGE